jgi:hypothetical protein
VNVRCDLTDECHLTCPCKTPHLKTKACNKRCSLYARARCTYYFPGLRGKTKFAMILDDTGFKPIIEVDPVIDKMIDAHFANKKITTKKILINKK